MGPYFAFLALRPTATAKKRAPIATHQRVPPNLLDNAQQILKELAPPNPLQKRLATGDSSGSPPNPKLPERTNLKSLLPTPFKKRQATCEPDNAKQKSKSAPLPTPLIMQTKKKCESSPLQTFFKKRLETDDG